MVLVSYLVFKIHKYCTSTSYVLEKNVHIYCIAISISGAKTTKFLEQSETSKIFIPLKFKSINELTNSSLDSEDEANFVCQKIVLDVF